MLKDKSYHTLSRQDKLLALSGVPINFLKKPIEIEQFNFMSSTMAYSPSSVVVIQADYQAKFIRELIDNISCVGESSTYAIGSYPTDQASYQLATLLTKAYFEHISATGIYPKIKWIDLGCPDWDFLKSSEECALLVVHGISENTSDNRKIELAKDFLRKGIHTTRVILAVTPNILTYAITKLEVSPDGVFQLNKTTNRVCV
jgi:hypothetical protein